MKIVQLIGTCPMNVRKTPAKVEGVERWCANDPKTYMRVRFPEALKTWTRWFNVHSPEHIRQRHPQFMHWAKQQDGTRHIYTRDVTPDIPGNVVFPGPALQRHFNDSYFTHQAAWLVAFAVYEGFERIELWGYQFGEGAMTERKYAFERPCIQYWVGRARQAGVEVITPPEANLCHADYLYGYDGPPL